MKLSIMNFCAGDDIQACQTSKNHNAGAGLHWLAKETTKLKRYSISLHACWYHIQAVFTLKSGSFIVPMTSESGARLQFVNLTFWIWIWLIKMPEITKLCFFLPVISAHPNSFHPPCFPDVSINLVQCPFPQHWWCSTVTLSNISEWNLTHLCYKMEHFRPAGWWVEQDSILMATYPPVDQQVIISTQFFFFTQPFLLKGLSLLAIQTFSISLNLPITNSVLTALYCLHLKMQLY